MGYTTDFDGKFVLNKPLDAETKEFLTKFNETRRMKRDRAALKKLTGKDYGVDGEFFVDGDGMFGQGDGGCVLEHNDPPKTQPSLWCQWTPNEDGTAIEWDQGEKFYSYIEWIEYIIKAILVPRGYSLTGDVIWQGEETGDVGVISIKDNLVKTYPGVTKVPKARKAKPKIKTVLPNEVEFQTCVHPNNGRKYVDAASFAKALTAAKKAGAGLDFAISELKRLAKDV